MGCFLGCLGLASSRRKNRRSAKKILPRDQRFVVSYEPLLSSAPTTPDASDSLGTLDFKLRGELKEKTVNKTKKKVTFNLNVQSYEPIPKSSDEEDEEETKTPLSIPDNKLHNHDAKSYPSNYRYKNCYNGYDEEEEDELAYAESDLDDDECYTDDEDEYETASDTEENLNSIGEETKSTALNPILNPVENLAQWKLIKGKSSKQSRKENVEAMPLLNEIVVNASLSCWISSPKNFNQNATTTSMTRNVLGRSPISDITNVDNS